MSKSKESKEAQEGFPNNFLVDKYGLRRAERREDVPSMSSEVQYSRRERRAERREDVPSMSSEVQ